MMIEADVAARCSDSAALNDWHPVSLVGDMQPSRVVTTVLLGRPIALLRGPGGAFCCWDNSARAWSNGQNLAAPPETARFATTVNLAHLWVCLGEPRRRLFQVPESDEPDRVFVTGGKIGLKASPLRVIENFLDMGHFPYVHTGVLGAEPLTEVRDYSAEITADNEVLVTGCGFYQPKASLVAERGFEVEYTYRVPRPYCAILYKTAAKQPSRRDVLALFLQPIGEEACIAHPWRALLDMDPADPGVRSFQQQIFGQDRPILENQLPKRLPLDPRAERHVRSDAASAVFRRWLRGNGVCYGAIPAVE